MCNPCCKVREDYNIKPLLPPSCKNQKIFSKFFITQEPTPMPTKVQIITCPSNARINPDLLCPVYSAPFSPPNLLSVHLSPLYFLRIKKGFASSIFCNTRSNVIDLWQVNSSPQTFSEKVCKQKDLCGGEIKTGLCPYHCKTLSIQKQTQLSRDDGSLITD